MRNLGLPKNERLLKRTQFLTLSRQGIKVHTDSFLALVLNQTEQHHRLGITVSKKVGNAVARNRIKRLIREYFRHHKETMSGPKDMNIIAKKGLTTLSNRQIIEKLDKLFSKIAMV